MEIKKYVYLIKNDNFVSNIPPRIECIFTIREFDDKFMAYVKCKNTALVKEGQLKSFEGNSLWGIGSLPLAELKERIGRYQWIGEIQKDFSP